MRKSHYIFIVVFVIVSPLLQAQDITQNTTINNALSSMFEDMELGRVPTGYLLDRAVEVANLGQYDGTITTSNVVDALTFRNCLLTLNSAIVNTNATSLDGSAITNALADTMKVNIGVALFRYNHIVSNALSDGLISYNNSKVADVYVNGSWQNPYGYKTLFICTPSASGHKGLSVTYNLSSNHLCSNLSLSCLSSIQIDLGDGYGYRTVNMPYEQTIIYTSDGEKELKMRVVLSDNTVLESHAKIEIFPQPITPAANISPTNTTTVSCTDRRGLPIRAKVCGYSGHSGSIVKPFIFVEGFDNKALGIISNIKQLYKDGKAHKSLCALIESGAFDNISNKLKGQSIGDYDFHWLYDNAFPESLKSEYDVFYVDWNNPEADIRDNAQLLILAINWINSLKSSTAQRNIVIGHSMGGLVARYALCAMESSGVSHETDCYVSYDSPQMGVNVPLGLQYAFRDAYQVLYGTENDDGLLPKYNLFDPVFSYIKSIYGCPSAKQMMYYFVTPNGTVTDYYHEAWQSILDDIGFPQGDTGHSIENLAIVNGGALPLGLQPGLLNCNVSIGNNSVFSPGWLQLLLPLFTRAVNLDLSFSAFRNYGDGGVVSSAQASYKKTFSWLTSEPTISLFGSTPRTHNSPYMSIPLDDVASSYLSMDLDTVLIAGNDYVSVNMADKILFVPASSALAMSDYNANFYLSPPSANDETPFDSYYLNDSLKRHEHTIPYYFNWIKNQTSCSLSGPDGIALDGDVFSVTDNSSYSNPTWTISDPSVASIYNGALTVFSGKAGVITVRYNNNNGLGEYIKKKKRVFAGFPNMTLSSSFNSGNSYQVTAACTSEHSHLQSVLDSLATCGKISYIWGYKNSDDSYMWTDTTSTSMFNCTASLGVITHVCMKMTCGTGRDSEVYVKDIDRRQLQPFICDPQETVVSDSLHVSNYAYISYFRICMPEYFAVWKNSDYTPTVANPDNLLIGTQTIPLETTYTQTIEGESKTVYCFDFMQSTQMQTAIANAASEYQSGGTDVMFVRMHIRNGTTNLQTLDYPVIPGEVEDPLIIH